MEVFNRIRFASNQNTFEQGHICYSKNQRNSVISNTLGAAAYYGNNEIIAYLIMCQHEVEPNPLDFPATEHRLDSSAYKPEFRGFTPVMLAVVGGSLKTVDIESLLPGAI